MTKPARCTLDPGDKYALIVLPRLPLDTAHLPEADELSPGMWFTRKFPIAFQKHWIEWLGTTRADRVSESQLTLMFRAASSAPDVLDADNEHVMRISGRLYQALQLAVPFWVDGEVVQLTGAHRGDQIDVRQVGTIAAPVCVDPGQREVVSQESLTRAAMLVGSSSAPK